MRRRDTFFRLNHDPGQHRGIKRRCRIAEMAERRERVGHGDPARRGDHRQRLGCLGGQGAGEPLGQRARQRRHSSLGGVQAGRDLLGPERVAAGLGGHEPSVAVSGAKMVLANPAARVRVVSARTRSGPYHPVRAANAGG
jgi:hypothetical protein